MINIMVRSLLVVAQQGMGVRDGAGMGLTAKEPMTLFTQGTASPFLPGVWCAAHAAIVPVVVPIAPVFVVAVGRPRKKGESSGITWKRRSLVGVRLGHVKRARW